MTNNIVPQRHFHFYYFLTSFNLLAVVGNLGIRNFSLYSIDCKKLRTPSTRKYFCSFTEYPSRVVESKINLESLMDLLKFHDAMHKIYDWTLTLAAVQLSFPTTA